jgi:hypothetical protein
MYIVLIIFIISSIKTALQPRQSFLLTNHSRGDISRDSFPELKPDEEQTKNLEKLISALDEAGGVKILNEYLKILIQDHPTLQQLIISEIEDQKLTALLQKGLESVLKEYSGLKKLLLLLTVCEFFDTLSYDPKSLFEEYLGLKNLLTFFFVNGGLDSLHEDIKELLAKTSDIRKILAQPTEITLSDDSSIHLGTQNSLNHDINSLVTNLTKGSGISFLPEKSQSILKEYPDIRELLISLQEVNELRSLFDEPESLFKKYPGLENILKLLSVDQDLENLRKGIEEIISKYPNINGASEINYMSSDDPFALESDLNLLIAEFPKLEKLLTSLSENENNGVILLGKKLKSMAEQYPELKDLLTLLEEKTEKDYSSLDLQTKFAKYPDFKHLLLILTLGYVKEPLKQAITSLFDEIKGLKKLLTFLADGTHKDSFRKDIETILSETFDFKKILLSPEISSKIIISDQDNLPKFSVTQDFRSLLNKIAKKDKTLPVNIQSILEDYPEFKSLLVSLTTSNEVKSLPDYLEFLFSRYPGLKNLLSLLTIDGKIDSLRENFEKILSENSDLKMLFSTNFLSDDFNSLSRKYESLLKQNRPLSELLEKLTKKGITELLRQYLESLTKQDQELKDLLDFYAKKGESTLLPHDLEKIISKSKNLKKLLTLITMGYFMESSKNDIENFLSEHKGLMALLKVFDKDDDLDSLKINITSLLADTSDIEELLKSPIISAEPAKSNENFSQGSNGILAIKELQMPNAKENEKDLLHQETVPHLSGTSDHKVSINPHDDVIKNEFDTLMQDSSATPSGLKNNATSQASAIPTDELNLLNQNSDTRSSVTFDSNRLPRSRSSSGSPSSLKQKAILQPRNFHDSSFLPLNSYSKIAKRKSSDHELTKSKLKENFSSDLSQDLDTEPSIASRSVQLDLTLQGDDPDTRNPFKNINKSKIGRPINAKNALKDKLPKEVSKGLKKSNLHVIRGHQKVIFLKKYMLKSLKVTLRMIKIA